MFNSHTRLVGCRAEQRTSDMLSATRSTGRDRAAWSLLRKRYEPDKMRRSGVRGGGLRERGGSEGREGLGRGRGAGREERQQGRGRGGGRGGIREGKGEAARGAGVLGEGRQQGGRWEGRPERSEQGWGASRRGCEGGWGQGEAGEPVLWAPGPRERERLSHNSSDSSEYIPPGRLPGLARRKPPAGERGPESS